MLICLQATAKSVGTSSAREKRGRGTIELEGNDEKKENEGRERLTCDVEVSVHLKDSSERSVERVVESSRVVSSETFLPHEHLGIFRFGCDGFLEGSVVLEGSSTSPDVQTSERISSSDLSRDVEVILVELPRTGSRRVGPGSSEVDVD